MKNYTHIHKAISNIMHSSATIFKKKHGNWLVKYLKDNQVAIMDTWNGHVYLSHQNEKPIEDDGYVDTQLHGKIHTIVSERETDLFSGTDIYKALLKS